MKKKSVKYSVGDLVLLKGEKEVFEIVKIFEFKNGYNYALQGVDPIIYTKDSPDGLGFYSRHLATEQNLIEIKNKKLAFLLFRNKKYF